MFDFLHEIMATIRTNRMRTLLTGFAVAWGIFMLIILMGAGNGLRNGMTSTFSRRAMNSVTVYPGRTSMPWSGYRAGRQISFDQRDYDLAKTRIPGIGHISTSTGQDNVISYGQQYGTWYTAGVAPGEARIYNLPIPEGQGRFINEVDIGERRKVVVISDEVRDMLFGGGGEALGRHVDVSGTSFLVVGVYDDQDQHRSVYIPFTTAQMLYARGYGLSQISFTVDGLDTGEEIDYFNNELRRIFAAFHHFDPADRSALYIQNTAAMALDMRTVFAGIGIFVWIIGIASMMAGIVGVGNIMLVTVRERTREIGIRKAIGATPHSILKLIILEAVFIMTAAGYAGILLGVGLTELVSSAFFAGGGGGGGPTMFLDPTVEMGTVVAATLFLIACGTVAGLIPALKATRIRPIEAMRAE